MLEDMATDESSRTELRAESFVKLVKAFRLEIGGHFDHVLPYLVPQAAQKKKPPQSFYLYKNGVTNLMSCFMKVLADPSKDELIAPILRALYSYESWQQVRKTYRHTEQRDEVISDRLKELLSIDIERDKTPMPEMYSKPGSPMLHDLYELNGEALEKLTKKFYYADYMVLLPELLRAAMLPNLADAVRAIREAPRLCEETMRKALGIDYDMSSFRFYNTVQAFLHPDAADRFADNQSNFLDVVDREAAEAMVRNYVRGKFMSKYRQDLVAHNKEEYRLLMAELVQNMLDSETSEKFCELFRNGLAKGLTKAHIGNTANMGYVDLRDGLTDSTRNVPLRVTKIQLLLLGRDAKDEPIWNGGNVLFVKDLEPFRKVLCDTSAQGELLWDKMYKVYMSRRRHIYREKPNRCGHHNEKPSFWAIGYGTLDDMVKAVSNEEWEEYKTIHHDCCGVPQLLSLVVPKRNRK